MIITELSSRKDELAWDDFVAQNPNATFFHQTAWKELVEKCYKFRSIYLMAKEGEEIKGILPLFIIKNIFLGRRLISIPFSTVGGVCANSPVARDQLIGKAIELTKNLNCDYLELRSLEKENSKQFVTNNNYFTFDLQMSSDPETVWKNLRKTNRNLIRRAYKSNLKVILGSKEFDKFYQIYSQGQRNLGTPIQDYKWLENLFFTFPNNHFIATAETDGETVAAFFLRYYKTTVSWVFGYSLQEYRDLYPNHIMLWELIKDSCRKGYESLSFGRSVKSSGTYFFKAGWSAKPVQLCYHYYLNTSKKIPDTSQESVKRQLFAKVWKKLPVPLANTLGPSIRKYFP